jgi:hypothetical protein
MLIRRRLTSLFPAEHIDGIARPRDAVQRHQKIDITMLVWSLILGFAVGTKLALSPRFNVPTRLPPIRPWFDPARMKIPQANLSAAGSTSVRVSETHP